MFLTKEVEEGDEKGGSSSYHSAEIEIMIAGIYENNNNNDSNSSVCTY